MSASLVITLDQIMNSQQTLLAVEAGNKTTMNSMDFSAFRTNLYGWASAGYPDSYLAYTFLLNMPPTDASGNFNCSDGTARSFTDYVPFCLGTSIQTLVDGYQAQLYGMTLSYALNESPYSLLLNVSKA